MITAMSICDTSVTVSGMPLGHAASCVCEPSAMLTMVMISLTATVPSPLQSPTQIETGVFVGVGVGVAVGVGAGSENHTIA